jgi:hypothetical protein
VRNIDTNFALSQTNFNRRVAAERQVEAVQAAYDAGTVTFDQLLDAQRRRADAESGYYRSLVDYNRSISQLHFRKGSLLEYNGVFLSEGPWPGKAYFDAYRRARQRDASLYLDYRHSKPGVFSRGAITQRFADVGSSTAVEQLEPRDPATFAEPAKPTAPADGKQGDGKQESKQGSGKSAPAPESVPLPEPKGAPAKTTGLPMVPVVPTAARPPRFSRAGRPPAPWPACAAARSRAPARSTAPRRRQRHSCAEQWPTADAAQPVVRSGNRSSGQATGRPVRQPVVRLTSVRRSR